MHTLLRPNEHVVCVLPMHSGEILIFGSLGTVISLFYSEDEKRYYAIREDHLVDEED